jgi:tetraacyldisaccharide 4'-kinase
MRLQVGAVQPLHGGRPQPLAMFAGQRVHAVAGIGDPERFFAMLRDAGIAVVPHAFPDHHAYAAPDFDFGSRLPVLMTAKDAVKCAGLVDAQAFMVPVEAVLPEPFWLALLDRLPARSR